MLYELRHARIESTLIARAVKQAGRGRLPKLPDAVANAPRLAPGNELYNRAFWELSSDRIPGGRIPYSSRLFWARANRLDEVATQWVIALVGKMDLAYIAHVRDNKPGKKEGDGDGKPATIRLTNSQGGG